MSHRRQAAVVILSLATAGLFACDREEPIRTYDAPKDARPQQPSAPPAEAVKPAAGVTPVTLPGMTASIPNDWKAGPANPMRVATYAVAATGAEVQITRFPVQSFTADPDGNINRWRGQVGLPPVASASSATQAQTMTVGGAKASVYDFANPQNGRRQVLAMVTRGDVNWYIKILGPTAAVTDQKPAFDAFLQSVRFE